MVWLFRKKEKHLTIDLIFYIHMEFMKIFKLQDDNLIPKNIRQRKELFENWKEEKELKLKLDKIIINLNLIDNFFNQPFQKLKNEILIRQKEDEDFTKEPITLIHENYDEEIDTDIIDFLVQAYKNRIIEIFINFLDLQSDTKSAIKYLRDKGIKKRECDLALEALEDITPKIADFIKLFKNLIEKEYDPYEHRIAMEKAKDRFDVGPTSRRRAA